MYNIIEDHFKLGKVFVSTTCNLKFSKLAANSSSPVIGVLVVRATKVMGSNPLKTFVHFKTFFELKSEVGKKKKLPGTGTS